MKKSDNMTIWWGSREKGTRGKTNNLLDLVFKRALFKITNISKHSFASSSSLMSSLYYWLKLEFELKT